MGTLTIRKLGPSAITIAAFGRIMPKRKVDPEEGILSSFPSEVTVGQLAELFGMSTRNVRTLIERGIIPKLDIRGKHPLKESLQNYLKDLRKKAAGHATDDGDSLSAQRARLTKTQAEQEEIKLRKLRGEMVPVDVMIEIETGFFRTVRASVLRLPSSIRHAIPHLTSHDSVVLGEIVREALADISADVAGSTMRGDRRALAPTKSGEADE